MSFFGELAMNNRERAMAVLHYKPYDRLPIVHFGFWDGKTLPRWAKQGHLPMDMAMNWGDGNEADLAVTKMLGFDFNWQNMCSPNNDPRPAFERRVVCELPDGSQHIQSNHGVTNLYKPGAGSIPAEIDHLLKDRASWEEHYKWRLEWSEERVTKSMVRTGNDFMRWDEGGLDFLQKDQRDYPYGLYCGSLFGRIRNIIGLVGVSYMQVDDPDLFTEIVDTWADLCYQDTKYALESGAKFDFGHFWEDICCKSGPLINPAVFAEKVGPHYKRITDLLREYGIDIVSLDCDGVIDALIPTWLENGVNTMFPIEVGVWDASIGPWREQYGRELLGVGGMNKNVFARDKAAVQAEVERLKPLVDLGGYIPCPDHRIADDGEWDLVCYYTELMRKTFG
jgi:hypothetical protein